MIKSTAVLLTTTCLLLLAAPAAHTAEPTKLSPPPAAPAKPEKKTDPLVDKVLEEEIPASPAEIQRIVKTIRGVKEDMNPPDPVQPLHRVISYSLAPGQEAHQITTRAGRATTLTFFDQSGAPWPIETVVVGLQDAYSVEPSKPDGKSHLVFVSPLQPFANSNLKIVLKGLNRALSFQIVEGAGKTMDDQVDVSVPMMGPQGIAPLIDRQQHTAGDDPALLAVLSGVPPRNAAKLSSSQQGVQAWSIDGMTYVRSTMEILSPAYTGRTTSADGMKAYVLVDRPIIYVSDNGRPTQVRLTPSDRVKQ